MAGTTARERSQAGGARVETMNHRLAAFTLLELLIVVAVVGLLAAVGLGAAGPILTRAASARESAAARNLLAAYHLSAAENNGRLLPGMDFSVKQLTKSNGKPLNPAHAGQRYPFRLAPYFGDQIEGTLLVNRNAKQISASTPPGSGMYDYMVSCFPALGMNYYFVGGCVTSGGDTIFEGDCVTLESQAEHSVIVFASGGAQDAATKVDGYNILTPPRLTGPTWTQPPIENPSDPSNYGNVDPRYGGRAVCAFLDGSVRMLAIADLRDMRLWSKQAAALDRRDYTISQ